MDFDRCEASEPGVSVSMQLLGDGEGPLHRLLSPLVEAFTPVGEAVGVQLRVVNVLALGQIALAVRRTAIAGDAQDISRSSNPLAIPAVA